MGDKKEEQRNLNYFHKQQGRSLWTRSTKRDENGGKVTKMKVINKRKLLAIVHFCQCN
jgi:hypothetical protein